MITVIIIICISIYVIIKSLHFLGSSVEVFIDDANTFTGLMFQDRIMKSVFGLYPEVILVDATYKLINLRMPLYLMMCIDGNGQGEIVLMYLTTTETEEAITKMVRAFKNINPQWEHTKVVISDKDFTERAVFQKEFLMLHCIFACFMF